ncbi:MAG: PhnD/SsuA/transferrin family substrate-binding protein [Byssovorax sp.]
MSEVTLLLGAVARDPRVLTFWEAMREHLRGHGITLDFALFSSYERQVDALLGGHVEVAFDGPLAHVRAKKRADGRIITLGMRDIDRDFQTKILVRRDAGIRALTDLHDRTFAVGSRDSVQARILPLHFLKRGGVDIARLKLVPFESDLGKHGDTPQAELDALAAVHEGRAEACAVGSVIWQAQQAEGKIDPHRVETLWTTPPYNHHALDALASLPEPKGQALQRVLFDLRWNNPKHRKLLEIEGMRQWVPCREPGFTELESALDDQRGW